MASSKERPVPVEVHVEPVNAASIAMFEFEFLVILGVATIVFAAISFALALAAKRSSQAIPKTVKVIACGTLPPVFLLAFGYLVEMGGFARVSSATFSEWLSGFLPEDLVILSVLVMAGTFTAWFVIRERKRRLDIGTFE